MFLLHHELTTLEDFGTTCIYVSCVGAYHIGMSLNCCMWMTIFDNKCVWWIHTCDIWNWLVGKLCHNWICDLLNLCIDEIWWMLWLCGMVYMYMGGFCWWLWIIELCSNCMSYLLVLIHLVNLFDDNYFGNSNEVRIAYVCVCLCIYMWYVISFSNDGCLIIPWNDEL